MSVGVLRERGPSRPTFKEEKDCGHPGMVCSILQAAKGFPKGQVPNQIKGEKVEPFHNVNHRITAFLFRIVDHDLQLFHKQVNVRLNMRFLLHHGLFRKSRSQKLPHASIIGIVCRYNHTLRLPLRRLEERGILGERLGSENVMPGLLFGKGELIRGNAYNVPILLVERLDIGNKISPQQRDDKSYTIRAPKGRPFVSSQRVEM